MATWTPREKDDARRLSTEQMRTKYPHHSENAIRAQRKRQKDVLSLDDQISLHESTTPGRSNPAFFTSDKKVGTFNWREANKVIGGMQQLKQRASFSQDTANIVADMDSPLPVIFLSDAHILSWGTDHKLFERITDEILAIPSLHVALLGDMAQMAIKLRSVIEVSDNMLPPELQEAYLESWLDEMADRILFACWGNHDIERAESLSGSSRIKALYNRRFVYSNGIGHIDLTVGTQTYRLAISHHFQGRSIYSPVHGAQRYLVMQGHDRDIAACGDSHVPGVLAFTIADRPKLAINTGTFQTNSGYAKRYFSLYTHPVFPVVVFDNEHHAFTPFWSINQWLRVSGQAAAFQEIAS